MNQPADVFELGTQPAHFKLTLRAVIEFAVACTRFRVKPDAGNPDLFSVEISRRYGSHFFVPFRAPQGPVINSFIGFFAEIL